MFELHCHPQTLSPRSHLVLLSPSSHKRIMLVTVTGSITVATLPSQSVTHTLFNRTSPCQMTHQAILAIFMGVVALAYDSNAVPQQKLIYGGCEDRSWYVHQNSLRLTLVRLSLPGKAQSSEAGHTIGA